MLNKIISIYSVLAALSATFGLCELIPIWRIVPLALSSNMYSGNLNAVSSPTLSRSPQNGSFPDQYNPSRAFQADPQKTV